MTSARSKETRTKEKANSRQRANEKKQKPFVAEDFKGKRAERANKIRLTRSQKYQHHWFYPTPNTNVRRKHGKSNLCNVLHPESQSIGLGPVQPQAAVRKLKEKLYLSGHKLNQNMKFESYDGKSHFSTSCSL